jgi:hypothetical protein
MKKPENLSAFVCDDYFESNWALHGYWSESEQLWLIESFDEIQQLTGMDFLQVGRPGVGGIGFGYRKALAGIWAYYPIESRFKYLAPDVAALIKGWCDNSITV